MTYTQLLQDLQKKSYKAVYFLHGEESFYIDELAHFFEHKILTEQEKAFNLMLMYGKDTNHLDIIDQARRYPVMAERQVIIVKEAQQLKGLQELHAYVTQPTQSTILVLCHKHKKLDARKKLGKVLKQSKQACVFESKRLYDNQVPRWIESYFKDKAYTIAPDAVAILCEYLGTDLSKIHNELQKLMLNLPKGTRIEKAQVQENIGISKDFNVFEFQHALGRRDPYKAHLIANHFASNPKAHPLVVILGTLYGFFSKIYICKFLNQLTDERIAEALQLRTAFFAKDYRIAAKKFSRHEVEDIIATLREIDARAKGVENRSTSQEELLRELVIRILHPNTQLKLQV